MIQYSKYYVHFLNVCIKVKDAEVFGVRGVVLHTLMFITHYLLVELGRQMEKKQKEVI